MNDLERLEAMELKRLQLSPDMYYTIKDEDGIIRPQAGLWPSTGYGREDAEERATKTRSTVALVRITEIKEES